MHQLWDWSNFFNPHVARMAGFCTGQFGSGMHECYIRKDREGVVRCWMRKSSRSSTWFPEGEGYKVFETVPEGKPGIAKAHTDATWGRAAVEATIRAWYNVMAVDQPKLSGIKGEWEQRFSQLPPSDDPSLIDPELHLQWVDLPVRNITPRAVWRPGGGQLSVVSRRGPEQMQRGVTEALENPPVNPITGGGRTAADVQRDKQAYHAFIRAQPGGEMAVYQSDYLFVQPPGHPLQLHRVASGLFIENGTAPDISFQSLEYMQVPNTEEGHMGGFWGEFTPKPNPNHKENNPKSGTKMVRHNEITREHIVLYDVRVVAVKKPKPPPGVKPVPWIRIHASSLQQLASIRPEFAYPEHLPESHFDDVEETDTEDEFGETEGETDTEGEEDPPPVIPAGFQVAETEPNPLLHFVIWADVRRNKPAWRTGIVTRVYPAGYTYRGSPFTHDARLDGSRDVVGVNLTPELKAASYWVPTQPIPDPATAPALALALTPAPAPAPALAPARTNTRPSRTNRA